ncbi:hypothetical protein JW758_05985 [Candidatus Peregrinibacteria bacterium]|nr:hypothetical protein [Candidatus Peregrinibacteria bacterium]
MDESNIPHFSKKILLLSILFLLINATWYVLTVFTLQGDPYRTVAPKLVFAASAHDIQIQTQYDKEKRSAEANQELISGTTISTGELQFAEIILENNVVRLDENTEITLLENNFVEYSTFEPTMPRLIFSLNKGNMWINAFDSIEVQSPRSTASFAHSVGSITYNEPINRLMVITGSADLDLFAKEGEIVTSYTVPLYNQITYLDTQIVSEYSQLKESKLKKELKMAPIASSVLRDDWVVRNTAVDSNLANIKDTFINSELSYSIKSGFNKVRSLMTFVPQTKRKLTIERAEIMLGYLLGGIQKNNDTDNAMLVLNDLSEVINSMESDPLMKELLTETFFAIGSVKINSPADLVKGKLMRYLLSQDGPYVLRSYLSDLRVNLNEFKLEDAEKIASDWIGAWGKTIVKENLQEFTKQSKMFHRILLTYSDRTTGTLLSILDESGKLRMDSSNDMEETRFVLAEEWLEISGALVANYRYVAAKQFLKNSYESLGIDNLEAVSQASQIFTEKAQLIAQRIQYAEDRMHSAAKAIDEKDFREYMQMQNRDDMLSENLKEFLQIDVEPEEYTKGPEIKDVVNKIAKSRVITLDSDIVPTTQSPFVFAIVKARLIDRADDGSQITFSATYDYSTDAVNNVVVGETPLNGSFALSDLVEIISKTKAEEIEQTDSGTDIYDLLGGGGEDEALRAQATAQELAKQLVVNELKSAGIQTAGFDAIEVLDALTLTKFRINEAYIPNPENEKAPLKIKFDFSTSTKKATNIIMSDGTTFEKSSVPIGELSNIISGGIIEKKREENALSVFNEAVTNNSLVVNPSDVVVRGDGNIEFTNMYIPAIPIGVSGTFNSTTGSFTSFSSEISQANNVQPEEYFKELGAIYINQFLEEKGMNVSEDQLTLEYPFDKITVKGYMLGSEPYSFDIDLAGSSLKNITSEESGGVIPSMSFEEFLSIVPVEPVVEQQPVEQQPVEQQPVEEQPIEEQPVE